MGRLGHPVCMSARGAGTTAIVRKVSKLNHDKRLQYFFGKYTRVYTSHRIVHCTFQCKLQMPAPEFSLKFSATTHQVILIQTDMYPLRTLPCLTWSQQLSLRTIVRERITPAFTAITVTHTTAWWSPYHIPCSTDTTDIPTLFLAPESLDSHRAYAEVFWADLARQHMARSLGGCCVSWRGKSKPLIYSKPSCGRFVPLSDCVSSLRARPCHFGLFKVEMPLRYYVQDGPSLYWFFFKSSRSNTWR